MGRTLKAVMFSDVLLSFPSLLSCFQFYHIPIIFHFLMVPIWGFPPFHHSGVLERGERILKQFANFTF